MQKKDKQVYTILSPSPQKLLLLLKSFIHMNRKHKIHKGRSSTSPA